MSNKRCIPVYILLIYITSSAVNSAVIDSVIKGAAGSDKGNLPLNIFENGPYLINSDYGARGIETRYHYGVDFNADLHTHILSPHSGVINHIYIGDTGLKWLEFLVSDTTYATFGKSFYLLHIFRSSGNTSGKLKLLNTIYNNTHKTTGYWAIVHFTDPADNTTADWAICELDGALIIPRTDKTRSDETIDTETTMPLRNGTELLFTRRTISAGTYIANTGDSGTDAAHLHISYGESSTEDHKFKNIGDKIPYNPPHLYNPLYFFNRPTPNYFVKFWKDKENGGNEEIAATSKIIMHDYIGSEKSVGNSQRMIVSVQSMPSGASVNSERGLDLNAVYFYLVPINGKPYPSGTDSSSVLHSALAPIAHRIAMFCNNGLGQLDFDSATFGKTPSIYYFFGTANSSQRTKSELFKPTSDAAGNDSIDVSVNYIKTRYIGGHDPGHDYYVLNTLHTKIKNGINSYAANNLAKISQDARIPDGHYAFIVKTKSIYHQMGDDDSDTFAATSFVNNGADASERREVIVDNFAPFIKKIEIKQGSGSEAVVVYSKGWQLKNDGTLEYKFTATPQPTPQYFRKADTTIVLTFSEPMDKSGNGIIGYYDNSQSSPQLVNMASTAAWNADGTVCTLSLSSSVLPATDKKMLTLSFSGYKDMNGNVLDRSPQTIPSKSAAGIFDSAHDGDGKHDHVQVYYGVPDETMISIQSIEFKQNGTTIESFNVQYNGNEPVVYVKYPFIRNTSEYMMDSYAGEVTADIKELVQTSVRRRPKRNTPLEVQVVLSKALPGIGKLVLKIEGVKFTGKTKEQKIKYITEKTIDCTTGDRKYWVIDSSSSLILEKIPEMKQEDFIRISVQCNDQAIVFDHNPVTREIEKSDKPFYAMMPIEIDKPIVLGYSIKPLVLLDLPNIFAKQIARKTTGNSTALVLQDVSTKPIFSKGTYRIELLVLDGSLKYPCNSSALTIQLKNESGVTLIARDIAITRGDKYEVYTYNDLSSGKKQELRGVHTTISAKIVITEDVENAASFRPSFNGYRQINENGDDCFFPPDEIR